LFILDNAVYERTSSTEPHSYSDSGFGAPPTSHSFASVVVKEELKTMNREIQKMNGKMQTMYGEIYNMKLLIVAGISRVQSQMKLSLFSLVRIT
jgi:hypothetical protein